MGTVQTSSKGPIYIEIESESPKLPASDALCSMLLPSSAGSIAGSSKQREPKLRTVFNHLTLIHRLIDDPTTPCMSVHLEHREMSMRSLRLALLCTWVGQKHVNMHRFLCMGVNTDMSVSHEGLTYGMDGYRGTNTKMSGAFWSQALLQAARKARLRVDLNMGHNYPPLNSKVQAANFLDIKQDSVPRHIYKNEHPLHLIHMGIL